MSDEEVIAASTQRVSTDVEKLTRRNMKECVSEHIQMLCMEDTAFARLTMHPKKNMIRCFQYINRKAWDYVQDELKASGTRPGPGQQTYGCDVPDDMCYQWAEFLCPARIIPSNGVKFDRFSKLAGKQASTPNRH